MIGFYAFIDMASLYARYTSLCHSATLIVNYDPNNAFQVSTGAESLTEASLTYYKVQLSTVEKSIEMQLLALLDLITYPMQMKFRRPNAC